MARFDLSDEEWAVIVPLLPKRTRGPSRKDDRPVLNGIFYILRTDAPWRDLPTCYGPRTTIYNRYVRWGRRGVRKGIFAALAEEDEEGLVFIGASIVKTGGGIWVKKGAWRKVLNAHAALNCHATVDGRRRPLRLGISAAHVHDSQMMELFLDWKKPPLAIVADKAYGSAKIRQQIADQAALAVIPCKSNARHPVPHDKSLYMSYPGRKYGRFLNTASFEAGAVCGCGPQRCPVCATCKPSAWSWRGAAQGLRPVHHSPGSQP